MRVRACVHCTITEPTDMLRVVHLMSTSKGVCVRRDQFPIKCQSASVQKKMSLVYIIRGPTACVRRRVVCVCVYFRYQ